MPFPRKTALALATGILMLAAIHAVKPDLGLSPNLFPSALDLATRHKPLTPVPSAPVAAATTPQPTVAVPNIPAPNLSAQPGTSAPRPPLAAFLFDQTGSLDSFFDALARLELPGNSDHVRILHYGDSPTTADLITGDTRALLQQRLGDAGYGYLLIAKPWAWYSHRGTDIAGDGWTISTAVGKGHPDTYGIGGASFRGGPDASSRITLNDGLQTRMELSFLAQPEGGSVRVTSKEGLALATVDTASAHPTPAWRIIPLPPGTKNVDIKPVSGEVTLFGATFTRAQHGILYDSLGLNGASTTVLSRGFNAEAWATELQHAAPALVIINYGTNESSFGDFVDKQYEGELRLAIGRIRKALPSVSILVMSPLDRGERSGIDEIHSMATIARIVAIQKRVAAETHCAFFDTFHAMGGDGTVARWYTAQPRLISADLIHPTPQGAATIAQTFVKNLMQGYSSYRAQHPPTTDRSESPPRQVTP